MGRIGRQRRYKACDPFSKQSNKININLFDNPPKRCEVIDGHFGKTKTFLQNQQHIERASSLNKKPLQVTGVKTTTKSKNVAADYVNNLPRKPNESQKAYFRRLDNNIQCAINKSIMDTKTLRKKRKIHLKARDAKKKKMKSKTEYSFHENEEGLKEFSSLKDEVKFGEVVLQPPSLSSAPRKAVKRKSNSTHHIAALFHPPPPGALDGASDEMDKRKRKQLTFLEQQEFDRRRQKAIDVYRTMKMRNNTNMMC